MEREKATEQANVKFTDDEDTWITKACSVYGLKRGQLIRIAVVALRHEEERGNLLKLLGRILGAL